MSILASLVDPRVLTALSEREVDVLNSLLATEILNSPAVMKELQTKIDPLLKRMGKKLPR